MATDKVTIKHGNTSVSLHVNALDKVLSSGPFSNTLIQTIIFVLFLFILDMIGFPVLFTEVGNFMNLTWLNGIVSFLLLLYVGIVIHRYAARLGGKR